MIWCEQFTLFIGTYYFSSKETITDRNHYGN